MAAEKRTIGLGMDYSPSSKAAVKWAVDNLVKAGDRIILIHVLPKGADASHKELWKSTGSPLIPLLEFMEMNVQARYGFNPDKEVLEILQGESKSKQIIKEKQHSSNEKMIVPNLHSNTRWKYWQKYTGVMQGRNSVRQ